MCLCVAVLWTVGACWLTDRDHESGMTEIIEWGNYNLILNRASPSERLRESHSQTYPLSLLHLDLTVCSLDLIQVLCMKLATMRKLYVSTGCESIPIITMENSPSCHLMGEILSVCLPASVCYSGTILLCLFSETVDL